MASCNQSDFYLKISISIVSMLQKPGLHTCCFFGTGVWKKSISNRSITLVRIYSIYPTCIEATVCNSHSIRDIFELPNNLVAGYSEIYTICMHVFELACLCVVQITHNGIHV